MEPVKAIPVSKARNQKPKADPHYLAAARRAKEAVQRLRQSGIIDADGHRIRKDLPADMQEGQDRDYGG